MGITTGVSIIVLFDRLTILTEKLPEIAARGLDAGCAELQTVAKNSAPVRTGALRDSGYRITALHDDYEQAVSQAASDNPAAGFSEKPAVDTSSEAVVGFAVDYAGFVSGGTVYMEGNPFFTNAQEMSMDKLVGGVEMEMEKTAVTGLA